MDPRFWSKVQERDDGCWVWTAYKDSRGYGRFNVGGRIEYAHRVAYTQVIGVIPEGLVIDHLCRNTSCVNPAHMEAVSHGENTARGIRMRRTDDQCANGHPWTNTYKSPTRGYRQCRQCLAEAKARSTARRNPSA
jgi:hypothetical protein